jgi:gluconolactonase
MNRRLLLTVAGATLSLIAADLPPESAINPVEVFRTEDYSEGVVVDHEGNLYFSHEKIITKISPDGKRREIFAETGQPNGHKILADGTHLVCDASQHAVLHLDATGKQMAPASVESDGKPLNGPNDLCLDPAGGFYFTDPLDPSAEKAEEALGNVHYVDPDGKTHTIARGLSFPNGIVLRPGGRELLVGESQKNRILLYPVLAPGKLGEMKVFVDLPKRAGEQSDNAPDGLALDAEGNLYVAHFGMRQVQVVSPQGKVIRRYAAGNRLTSNVAFAGPDMDQLFVTGGEPGAVFRLDIGVKGLTILPPKK